MRCTLSRGCLTECFVLPRGKWYKYLVMEHLNRKFSSLLHMLPCPLDQHGPIFVGGMRQTGARILKSALCIGVLNELPTWLFVIFYVSKASNAVSASENSPEYPY